MERKVIHVFYDNRKVSDIAVLNVIENIQARYDSHVNLIIQPLEVKKDRIMADAYGVPDQFEGVFIFELDKNNNQVQCLKLKTDYTVLNKLNKLKGID